MSDARDDQRAIVGDELEIARLGVSAVLRAQGLDVVAETHSGRELASVAALEQPDLVVVGQPADLTLVDTVRRVLRVRPRPPVVALVAPGQEDVVGMLVALGTRGIALRSGSADELAEVFASVLSGEPYVVPALQPALVGVVKLRPLDERTTELLSTRRARGARVPCARAIEPGDRGSTLGDVGHREVTPRAHLRQARRREPQRMPRPSGVSRSPALTRSSAGRDPADESGMDGGDREAGRCR